jgi:ATP-dependent helicase HrpB
MASRREYLEPEIHRVDLSRGLLQWLGWGESWDEELPWLDPPRPAALDQARRLLERLGAVTLGQLTAWGKKLVQLPLSPRLATLVLSAETWGHGHEIATAAALLSERDPFIRPQAAARGGGVGKRELFTRVEHRWPCDVTVRVAALLDYFQTGNQQFPFGEIHRHGAQQIHEVAAELRQYVENDDSLTVTTDNLRDAANGAGNQSLVPHVAGFVPTNRSVQVSADEAIRRALLAAFPDRLARRRGPQDARGLMVGGKGVKLAPTSGVSQEELFLCVDVNAEEQDAVVRLASGVLAEWLPENLITVQDELFFSPSQKQVLARRRRRWDDLLLSETPIEISDRQRCADVLYEHASRDLDAVFPRDAEAVTGWLARAGWLAQQLPELELPPVDENLKLSVLRQLCLDRRSFRELQEAPWLDWLQSQFTPQQLALIDQHAPERMTVPSGSRIRLEYQLGKPPVLAVRIQELFSWTTTPRIAMGRVPVLLHLLAPNMRPQQITDDLASFWANTYEVVRKELKRRYPKHPWPDDPRTATPIRKG